jgi:hypothetical protein
MRFVEIWNCIGTTGRKSIIKDFFGYKNVPGNFVDPGSGILQDPMPLPGPVSLLTQLKLLKNNRHIKIHIKVIYPLWFTPPIGSSIDAMIFQMRSLYASVGIAVVIKSYEILNIPYHYAVDVDDCQSGWLEDTSDEQNDLFYNNTNFVSFIDDSNVYGEDYNPFTKEIVIFFVRLLDEEDGKPLSGCALSPLTDRGAVIALGASVWTLAHEVGHDLGLGHVNNSNRLMFPGTRTNLPPNLTSQEVAKMKNSILMFTPC